MAAPSAAARPALRLLVALATAALLASVLSVAGGAEETGGISLALHLGYRDVVRAGQWMPVTVDATNKGSDFQGILEFEVLATGGFGRGVPAGQASSSLLQLPLSLPAGGTKQIRSFLLIDNPSSPIVARLLKDGRVIASQNASATNTAGTLVGVLSDQPAALDDFGAIRLSANLPSPQTVHLKREDLPDSAILLRAFDLLAIDDAATDGLTAAQRAALADYVATGGNLLLGTGASWRKTLAGIPPILLPYQPDGTAIIAETPALPGARGVEVASGTVLSGRTWLSAGSRPLLIEKTVGAGLVTLATFDWAQEPIASWGGTRGLVRQVAVRSLMRGSASAGPPAFGIAVPVPAGGVMAFPAPGFGSASITQRSSSIVGALGNLPALDLPSLKLTGLLILLYILVVGPVNYLALRAIGRRELAWVTVPAVAIIFAAGAYGIGVGTKGRAVESNQISIVHLISGWNNAYRETYTGVFTPTRGDYQVTIQGKPLVAPLAIYGPQGQIGGSIRIHPDQGSVDLLGVTAYTLRGFASEAMSPAPGLSATLRLQGGKLVGRVENHSSIRFSDGIVVAGDNFQSLGSLAPGAGADISVEPTSSVGMGPMGVLSRIYQQPYAPGMSSAGGMTSSQREAAQRSQILQLVFGLYKGQTGPAAPTLIAWTHDPLDVISVNGRRPTAHAVNAVVLPLALDQPASGPIPAGMVPGRLIDATGEVTINPTGLFLRNGSATFEFYAPIPAGSNLLDAGIRNTNPYGAKFAGGIALASFQADVWNWAKGDWVKTEIKDNDTAALPAGTVDPATGTVRLRIRSVGANQVQIGNLSLTGDLA